MFERQSVYEFPKPYLIGETVFFKEMGVDGAKPETAPAPRTRAARVRRGAMFLSLGEMSK